MVRGVSDQEAELDDLRLLEAWVSLGARALHRGADRNLMLVIQIIIQFLAEPPELLLQHRGAKTQALRF